MSCDTQYLPNQTLTERKDEIKKTILELDAEIRAGRVKIRIGPQGAIAFDGWKNRNRITDGCAFRRIMSSGSALARAEIAKAERLAGRAVDRKIVAQGVHAHGNHWHKKG